MNTMLAHAEYNYMINEREIYLKFQTLLSLYLCTMNLVYY